MSKVFESLKPLLPEDQFEAASDLLEKGYKFHSYFYDGSIELIAPEGPMYISKGGDKSKF